MGGDGSAARGRQGTESCNPGLRRTGVAVGTNDNADSVLCTVRKKTRTRLGGRRVEGKLLRLR